MKTLAQTRREVGRRRVLIASNYDSCRRDRYNPCGLTSSGEAYRPHRPDNAASPEYPNGTLLLVRNPRNSRTVVVRINNAGPYWRNRRLDLSRAAARRLGFRGVARVQTTVLKAPSRAQARYKRNRRYRSAPGYVGKYASLAAARTHVRQRYASLLGGSAGKTQVAAASSKTRRRVASKKRTTKVAARTQQNQRAAAATGAAKKRVNVAETKTARTRGAQSRRNGTSGTKSVTLRDTPRWFRDSVATYRDGKGRKVRQSQRSRDRSDRSS